MGAVLLMSDPIVIHFLAQGEGSRVRKTGTREPSLCAGRLELYIPGGLKNTPELPGKMGGFFRWLVYG